MKRKASILSAVFVVFLILSASYAQETTNYKQSALDSSARAWNPQRTWIYFVGLLEWKNKEQFGSFPQKNRRDEILLNVFRQSGVPENQIVYLKDSQATIAKVKDSFPKFLSQAKAGDTVVLYFCGHGYKSADNKKTYLATYDVSSKTEGWRTDEIPSSIEKNFKGSNAMIMADNCYSGALAEDVKALKTPRVSYAVMTSAHFNSFSTANWTFTESLIYAFRGDAFADDDHNGKITLGELEENVEDDMLFAEEQLAEVAFTGNFNKEMTVADAPKNLTPRLGERIESYSIDGYYKGFVRDVKGDKFQIHYYGYEDTDDEWVTAKTVRQSTPKQFRINERVEVEWLGKWFAAKVLKVKGGSHLVAYDGYGTEYDEWVSSKRIRETASGSSASTGDLEFKAGSLVEAADYRGAWYKSKIIAIQNGKYRVHFFGWDEKWDEWVTPDRVRNSNDYEFGREVEVEQNGVWYKALIIDSRYGTEHLVTYTGYNEDEWVKDERIRETGTLGAASYSSRYGKTVEVLSRKKWYRARVLDRRNGEVYVHYEGYSDTWNEWVTTDRVREIR